MNKSILILLVALTALALAQDEPETPLNLPPIVIRKIAQLLPRYKRALRGLCKKAENEENKEGVPTTCKCSTDGSVVDFESMVPRRTTGDSAVKVWRCKPESCECGTETVTIDRSKYKISAAKGVDPTDDQIRALIAHIMSKRPGGLRRPDEN